MKKTSMLPRLLCALIAFAAVAFFVATFRYERVSAVAANGKIAFTNSNQIHTMNPDGSGDVTLTPTGEGLFDHYPNWSPDGTRIAFGRATFTVKSQIYVMNADGSNPTRITNNTAADTQPFWSPDGTKIAFVSDRDGNSEIYVMNADGSNQTRLTNNSAVDIDPAWSPDGTKIAFSTLRDFTPPGGTFEIYVMDANGNNPVRLTNNSATDAGPSWSPDGTKIAFVSHRLGLPLVYVMNSDGSNPLNITQSATLDCADPEWSPDGTTIAFTSYARVSATTNSDEIFLMNADGSNIRRATTTVFDEHELAWQPAGVAQPTPSPTPTPTPVNPYTISGKVTNTSGQGIADVTMVMLSDSTGTEIAFTDQGGNYAFKYGGILSHNIRITPSKSGFSFNPIWIALVSSNGLSGDQMMQPFEGAPSPVQVAQSPLLLTQPNSQRALALDSVTWMSEPFGIVNVNNFSSDQRSRISLFAASMDLGPGETTSVIEVQAEDSLNQVFTLPVEHFGAVPNNVWLKQLVVKLPDEIANSFEVKVSVKLRGIASNKVIVKVKP